MGIPETTMKDLIGEAYIRTIVARAGFLWGESQKDFGIDGSIQDVSQRKGRYFQNGFQILFQLKSSSQVTIENNEVIYDLEAKNYNDLAGWEGSSPGILILVYLPANSDDWIDQTEQELSVRHCAWWCSLDGRPLTKNSSTVRIKIPSSQFFSVKALQGLMQKVRRRESL